MIKKVWAKFENLDLKCVCDEHHRKCQKDDDCKEYVVKFIEIDRNDPEEIKKQIDNDLKKFQSDVGKRLKSKLESEFKKSIRKFKI